MDNLHLVTGYLGREHVAAVDQGAFNAALIGTGQFVLDKGKVFMAQVISNNAVRVFDGEMMMQGRFIRLEPNTYVDLTVESGSQGMKRNDIIAVRYTKDTSSGLEGVNLVVIKGTPAASVPADPVLTEGDITNGAATLNEFPLWRIPIDGLNVGEPVALYGDLFADSMMTLPEMRRTMNKIYDEVHEELDGFVDSVTPKVVVGSYVGTGEYGQYNPNTLTLDGNIKLLIVRCEGDSDYGGSAKQCFFAPVGTKRIRTNEGTNFVENAIFAWDGNTVSWYGTNSATGQLNCKDETYIYCAWLN